VRVVDLSHPLDDRTPVVAGDPEVRIGPARSLERDGYRVSHLHLGSHSGTHLDAPSHVVEDGVGVDGLAMHLLVGPAVVVDLRDLGPREPVGWERLAAHARPGRMLVLHTGWDRFWGSVRYEDHPFLDAEAAWELVARGVRTVGIDTPSIDETGGEALPAHEALLSAGGVVVENLTNLAAVDHPEPVLSVLPLPLRGVDGSPVRAVALLPE
jgi:kynurenine formamidase